MSAPARSAWGKPAAAITSASPPAQAAAVTGPSAAQPSSSAQAPAPAQQPPAAQSPPAQQPAPAAAVAAPTQTPQPKPSSWAALAARNAVPVEGCFGAPPPAPAPRVAAPRREKKQKPAAVAAAAVRVIELDGRAWREAEDMYKVLLPALGAPKWHGHNLDAMNDSLINGDINAVRPPFEVIFLAPVGLGAWPDKLQKTINILAEIFERGAQEGINIALTIVERA